MIERIDKLERQFKKLKSRFCCFLDDGGGGGAVASVFGRTGVVVAADGDYDAFYASTALDNLASTAINTNLLPGVDNNISLGSTSKRWKNLFLFSSGTIDWNAGGLIMTEFGTNGLQINTGISGVQINGASNAGLLSFAGAYSQIVGGSSDFYIDVNQSAKDLILRVGGAVEKWRFNGTTGAFQAASTYSIGTTSQGIGTIYQADTKGLDWNNGTGTINYDDASGIMSFSANGQGGDAYYRFYHPGRTSYIQLLHNGASDGLMLMSSVGGYPTIKTVGNSILQIANSSGELLSIGSTTTTASAKVEIVSTTKGFLPPKMTKAQRNAIPSPVGGLTVIVTGEVLGEYLSIYNSVTPGWEKVTSVAD